ncbi:MAG: zincin-like metallopeptidase domain-containing protein [Sphingomonas sp.]
MRRTTSRAAKGERGDLYSEVTARIVAELEAGRVPWVRPWERSGTGPCLPHNAATRRPYSGINILLLWGAADERSFAGQGWLTFRQALGAGGAVRKGERGTTIFYADSFVPEGERARAVEQGDDPKAVAFLKRFTVFHVDQCDGLPEGLSGAGAPLPEAEQVPLAEAVIAASGVPFRIGGDEACYLPGPDLVLMPPPRAFFAPLDFYRTALHELTHATGHAKRLGRRLLNTFGSKDYAREELVAEMGSAFLCAALGIVPTVRHADYIGSWLAVLREDNRAIFRAASQASKAADWLLTCHREAEQAAAACPQAERIAA